MAPSVGLGPMASQVCKLGHPAFKLSPNCLQAGCIAPPRQMLNLHTRCMATPQHNIMCHPHLPCCSDSPGNGASSGLCKGFTICWRNWSSGLILLPHNSARKNGYACQLSNDALHNHVPYVYMMAGWWRWTAGSTMSLQHIPLCFASCAAR